MIPESSEILHDMKCHEMATCFKELSATPEICPESRHIIIIVTKNIRCANLRTQSLSNYSGISSGHIFTHLLETLQTQYYS